MPIDDDTHTAGSLNGNAGQLIYSVKHEDIDESNVDIFVHSGSVRAKMWEAVWYEWELVLNQVVSGEYETNRTVNSACCDGDHWLKLWARENGTSCDVTFSSEDW